MKQLSIFIKLTKDTQFDYLSTEGLVSGVKLINRLIKFIDKLSRSRYLLKFNRKTYMSYPQDEFLKSTAYKLMKGIGEMDLSYSDLRIFSYNKLTTKNKVNYNHKKLKIRIKNCYSYSIKRINNNKIILLNNLESLRYLNLSKYLNRYRIPLIDSIFNNKNLLSYNLSYQ